MSRKPPATEDSTPLASLSRRSFMGAVAGAGAGAAAAVGGLVLPASAQAEVQFPKERSGFGGGGSAAGSVYRSENDLYDCEVEGTLPKDLDGIFFRVGPDPQYPKPDKYAHDIPFDGEGMIGAFRIKDGHVDGVVGLRLGISKTHPPSRPRFWRMSASVDVREEDGSIHRVALCQRDADETDRAGTLADRFPLNAQAPSACPMFFEQGSPSTSRPWTTRPSPPSAGVRSMSVSSERWVWCRGSLCP